MPTVPQYQPDVRARGIFQQGVNVSASPAAFGAGIGQGMQALAQGVENLGDNMSKLRDLEDMTRAKEADNNFSNWAREAQYGENGFQTLEGKNAVDARAQFEKQAEEKRKEFGAKLTQGAAKAYTTASEARLQGIYQQSIVHTANERKTWFKQASTARVETFANDALANFNKPDLITKNLGAGILEIREQGALQGWDADTLKLRESEFASGIHKNITLRLAQDDPLKADAYMKAHANQITGPDTYALEGTIRDGVKNEQSKREADEIMRGSRSAAPAAGVGDDSAAGPAAAPGPATTGRKLGQSGPTRVREFLIGKAPRGAYSVDGLDEGFATNLAAMIQDAPPEIRDGLGITSGYRSNEHQKKLFANSNGSGRMVAFPAGARKPDGTIAKGSNHLHGRAVDLGYNGTRLDKAPANVRNWVHENAGKYGLRFPMSWEAWHIEPTKGGGATAPGRGSTVTARSEGVAARSTMPSYDEIETRLAAISDPDVRDLTRKRINGQMEAQNKAVEQREKAAKTELWSYIDQGATPDQVPIETRQAAGMAAVSAAWGYLETASKGRDVDDDETLAYDMRRYAAQAPDKFAQEDLNDYRDRLSKATIKEFQSLQTNALGDLRKAREDGLSLTTAFNQAETQLQAVGIPTTGKEKDAARIAAFNNALASEMQDFQKSNDGRKPTQIDIQSMVNRLLLPVVIKQPGALWGQNEWAPDGADKTFAFDAGSRPDGSTLDIAVEYKDIPLDLRRGIALDLEQDLGRKPSEDEIVARYEEVSSSR